MRLHADGTEYFPWDVIRPKPGSRVYVRLRSLKAAKRLQIGIGARIGGNRDRGAYSFLAGQRELASGLLFTGAGMAAGGLLQPPAPKSNSPTSSNSSYSLTGTQNTIAQVGQLVPFVAGRWAKVFPMHIAQPYTTWEGSTQYMHCLLSAGLGAVDITNLKIGDVLVTDMDNVKWQIRPGFDTDAPTTLYPSVVYEALSEPHGQAIQITHSAPGAQTAQITSGTVDHLFWEFTFPEGIFRLNSSGKVSESGVTIRIEIRHLGVGSFTTVDHPNVQKKVQNTTRYLFEMDVTPNPGGWESRVTRETQDDSGDGTGKSTNSFYWTAFRGTSSVAPVKVPGHSLIALKIPATQRNQGSLSHISCDVTRFALDWNGTQWVEAPTANPASIFRLIPQHLRSNRGEILTDSQIDLLRVAGLASALCSRRPNLRIRLLGRGVDAGSPARGRERWPRLLQHDRRHSSASSKTCLNPTYVDAIGPHNSNNFVKRASYKRLPHGVRISFYDQTHEMTRQEIIAYNDGYNAGGTAGKIAASIFDDIDLTERGITIPARAWEEGRFYLAEMQHRRWSATQDMDFGGFFARRGERVSLTQPAALLGISDGYITSVAASGGNTTADHPQQCGT